MGQGGAVLVQIFILTIQMAELELQEVAHGCKLVGVVMALLVVVHWEFHYLCVSLKGENKC